jgi:hypothetical protein
MRLWTDEDVRPLLPAWILRRARSHSEASNLIRYEVLRRFGGLYVDTDVECKRPIEPLIDDAPAFCAWVRPGRIGSAVLGATPGHPAIETLLTEMQSRVGKGNQIEATVGLLTEVLSAASDVTVFESDTFYPYHPRHNPADPDGDFEGAYAVHHWGLTWKTRDELRDRVRGLRDKLEEAERETEKLKRQRRRLRKRLRRARARNEKLAAELDGSGRRARSARAGGWSRARRLARPAAPLVRRIRGRARS